MINNNNHKVKTKTDSTLIFRYPEDTIDGQRYEDEYKEKHLKGMISHAEHQQRLIFMEKKWNEEKDTILKNINKVVIQWGIDNKVYIRELLKELSSVK